MDDLLQAAAGLNHQIGRQDETIDRTSVAYTEKLFQLVRRRRDALTAIHHLTKTQSSLSGDSKAEMLARLLAQKQIHLDELADITFQMAVFQQDDPESRNWSSPQRREQCQVLADEAKELLAKVIRYEEKTISEMSEQRDAVAAQLQSGKDSVLAKNAYQAGEQLEEGQLDLGGL